MFLKNVDSYQTPSAVAVTQFHHTLKRQRGPWKEDKDRTGVSAVQWYDLELELWNRSWSDTSIIPAESRLISASLSVDTSDPDGVVVKVGRGEQNYSVDTT